MSLALSWAPDTETWVLSNFSSKIDLGTLQIVYWSESESSQESEVSTENKI